MTDEALVRAQDGLALHDIYLIGASLWLAEDFFPSINEESLSVQTRQRTPENAQIIQLSDPSKSTQDPQSLTLVRYSLEMGLRLVRKSEDNDSDSSLTDNTDRTRTSVRAEIISTFAVEYRVTAEEVIDDTEALDAFGSRNALFHVWPYWREYIQSTLARARIPQVVLPMFRLPRHSPNQ